MSANNNSGTIFIREKTLLPAVLSIESEAFLPGWRAVRNLNGYELGRKIAQVRWSFFYLAGEMRTIVLGSEEEEVKRQAVRRTLRKLKSQRFNCLEITGVAAKHFLGIHREFSTHTGKCLSGSYERSCLRDDDRGCTRD